MEQKPAPQAGRFLQLGAYAVLIVAGLRAAADLVVPLLLAAVLALICMQPIRWLRGRGLPGGAAIAIVLVGVILAAILLSGVVGASLTRFALNLDAYEARVADMVESGLGWLEKLGLNVKRSDVRETVNAGALMRLVAGTIQDVLNLLSDLVVILLVTAFMVVEASGLPKKLRRAAGREDADLGSYERAAEQIYRYFSLKTGISLVTGVLVTLLCLAAGVDLPFLWGLVAFLFNYVPNIGSFIAAIPAVVLAFALQGPGIAAAVAGGYVLINMVMGNVVEPRVMGRGLGLSPLVVLLSLIFWGWVLGPVGMLLSPPLTIVVKIALEATEDYRGAAVLLGPAE